MAFGVFHLQPLGADSSQAEKSSPPPGQQINLRREVAHQGRLKKMHSALKPREHPRSRSLAEKLREELKNSITHSGERKSCSPAFLFIFSLALKKMPHFHFSEAAEAGNNTKALYKAGLLSSVASVLKYL